MESSEATACELITAYLFTCPSIHLSIYLPIYLSIGDHRLSIYPFIHMPIYLSVYLSFYLFARPEVLSMESSEATACELMSAFSQVTCWISDTNSSTLKPSTLKLKRLFSKEHGLTKCLGKNILQVTSLTKNSALLGP